MQSSCAQLSGWRLTSASLVTLDVDLSAFGGSALTDRRIAVTHHDRVRDEAGEIPMTCVPARNTVFLSLALAWAETLDSGDHFIGVNARAYRGYPDCGPEYIYAFERMANLAIKRSVEGRRRVSIHAPLIDLTKAEIIRRGLDLGVNYGITHSCYDPVDMFPCGKCDSC